MSKKFKRQNSHKHGRVPESWRRPRGKHSPRRKQKAHAAPVPKPGYRSPTEVRGLHPSGYEDVLVHRPADLEDLDPEEHAVRIASGVGGRKRAQIAEDAAERGLKLLNHEREDDEQ